MTAPAPEPAPPPPPPPEDPVLLERRLRVKRRAPLVLLAIGVVLVAAGGQLILGAGRERVEGGFWALGAGASFAATAALLGRLETRRWMAGAFGAFTFVMLGQSIGDLVDKRAGALALGFTLGAMGAWFLARRLDPEWSALVDRLAREREKAARAAQKAKLEQGRAEWARTRAEYAARRKAQGK